MSEDINPRFQFQQYRGRSVLIDIAPPANDLRWRGKEWRFEFHAYLGPTVLKKNGDPLERQPGLRSPFWDGFQAWADGGKRVDEHGACILFAGELA